MGNLLRRLCVDKARIGPVCYKRTVTLFVLSLAIALVASAAVGFVFGVPSTVIEVEQTPDECMLNLGGTTTLDAITDDVQYMPLWIKLPGVSVEVRVQDDRGVLNECQEILSYSPEDKRFDVNGIGKGEIVFTTWFDRDLSLTVPFETNFISEDISSVVRAEYESIFEDGKVTSEELCEIKELSFSKNGKIDLADLIYFDNISKVHLTCKNEVAVLTNYSGVSGLEFMVSDDMYSKYKESDSWKENINHVFPDHEAREGKFMLVLDLDGGKLDISGAVEDMYYCYLQKGTKLSEAEFNIQKTGFTFTGWFEDRDNVSHNSVPMDGVTLDSDMKFHATWSENEYTIVYNNNGSGTADDVVSRQTLKYTEEGVINVTPAKRTGYTFKGWSRNSKATTPDGMFAQGNTVSKLSADNGGKVDVYAVWEANSYAVKYYDGDSLVDSQPLQYGQTAVVKDNTSNKRGYVFQGWATSKDSSTVKYKPGNTIENLVSEDGASVELYAVWRENKYSISYNAGAYSPTYIPERLNVMYSEKVKISETEPIWEGHVFLGWSLEYKSVYDLDDTLPVMYTKGASVSGLSSKDNDKIVLYAVWQPDTFSVLFNNGSTTDTLKAVYGEKLRIRVNLPTKTGKSVVGWSTSSNASAVDYSGVNEISATNVKKLYGLMSSDKKITLYAVWGENEYTLEYDVNGGAPKPDDVVFKHSKSVTLASVTKRYNTFSGWKCSANDKTYAAGKTVSISDFGSLKNNAVITMTAIWTPQTYIVKYDGDGVTAPAQKTVSYGDNFYLPSALVKAEYEFKGWKCSEDGNVYNAGQKMCDVADTANETIVFTAVWEKITTPAENS